MKKIISLDAMMYISGQEKSLTTCIVLQNVLFLPYDFMFKCKWSNEDLSAKERISNSLA